MDVRNWTQVQVVNVVDGDTVDAVIDMGFSITTKQRLRLHGINTPERGEPGYLEAKEYMQTNVPNVHRIETLRLDKYGRIVANLYATDPKTGAEFCLNGAMILLGLAKSYMP